MIAEPTMDPKLEKHLKGVMKRYLLEQKDL